MAISKAPDPAQLVKPDFRFEVVSIRPADPSGLVTAFSAPSSPNRFRADSATIASLAMQAFGAKRINEIEYQRWMASTYFNVNATIPQGATKADLPIMIQYLLEDRFGLVYHHQIRQMSGYTLVVEKFGSRLAQSAPSSPLATINGPSLEMKDGVPQFTKDSGSGQLMVGATTAAWRGRNKTMTDLAQDLGFELGMPVVDATGLGGKYDYTLIFTPEAKTESGIVVSPPPLGNGANSAGVEDVPQAHPFLLEALQKQLGLNLRPAKNLSVNVVVLDSAKRKPMEN